MDAFTSELGARSLCSEVLTNRLGHCTICFGKISLTKTRLSNSIGTASNSAALEFGTTRRLLRTFKHLNGSLHIVRHPLLRFGIG